MCILLHLQKNVKPSVFLGFPGGTDGKESACQAGSWVLSLCQEDPMEKGMATHSSILAWRTPWEEEPGWLQSMGPHRVEYHWGINTFTSKCLPKMLALVYNIKLKVYDVCLLLFILEENSEMRETEYFSLQGMIISEILIWTFSDT